MIEGEIRGHGADVRRAVRQQKTKPLAEALRAWLEKTLAQVASGVSPPHPLTGPGSILELVRRTLQSQSRFLCRKDHT